MNFSELYNKIKEIDQRPAVDEGIMDTMRGYANQAGQAVQRAGQAVANTTLGDVGNAVKNYSLPGMAAKAVQGAASAIKGATAKPAPVAKMAPVKPADAFGSAPATPAAEFGDLPPQAQFGDLPPQSTAGAGRGSINPAMAVQPVAKAVPGAKAAMTGAQTVAADAATDKAFGEDYSNTDMEECGLPGMSSMPSGMSGMPKQQDNVTMNVSMNGSGAGGIRDLMGILKNIEQGSDEPPRATRVLVAPGSMSSDNIGNDLFGDIGEEQNDGGFGSATTEPSPRTRGIDSVTQTGDDMHSKGIEKPKVNGGGNPMQESLVAKLSQHYNEVKSR